MQNKILILFTLAGVGLILSGVLAYLIKAESIFLKKIPLLSLINLLPLIILLTVGIVVFCSVLPSNGPISPHTKALVVIFLVSLALICFGSGIHLVSDTLHSMMSELKGTKLFSAVFFFDETLSHYLTHLGLLGMIFSVIALEISRLPGNALSRGQIIWGIALGIVFGISLAISALEGRNALVVILGVLFISGVAYFLIKDYLLVFKSPALLVFLTALIFCFIFLVAWALFHRGFPEVRKQPYYKGSFLEQEKK